MTAESGNVLVAKHDKGAQVRNPTLRNRLIQPRDPIVKNLTLRIGDGPIGERVSGKGCGGLVRLSLAG